MAFLPDGCMLVTERPDDLRILDTNGRLSPPVAGTPDVFAQGQGGLPEVALDPDFQSNRLVYSSYAEPGNEVASTAVGRGKLQNGRTESFGVSFRQEPKVPGPNHFGSRLVFSPEGNLFVTLG